MIATLDEVKILLGISADDTSNDVQLKALLPSVQEYVLSYCNNDFASRVINHTSDSISFSSNVVTNINGGYLEDELKGCKDITISYSVHNDGNYTVYEVTDTTIEVLEDFTEENSDSNITIRGVNYPKGLKMIFSNMVGTKLGAYARGNIKSKKLESFAITYATEDMVDGFKKSDISALNKYRLL